MKILAIRGKNLASLEGEFEIDFTSEPLSSAGIFAITGQTGAGKSTLLDALCLALFDDTPRLNKAEKVNKEDLDTLEDKISPDDCRNILRRGASEAYAEVDFIALNGHTYRSRWAVKRARGRTNGKLQHTNVELDNLTNGNKEQGTKKDILHRITQVIGLTFFQFTRAVLLAQGDFANFLKAKQNDKAELLEKITGTGIYTDISKHIYHKTGEAKNELELIKQRIKDVRLLKEEEYHAYTEEKQRLQKSLEPLENQQTVIGKKLDWLHEEEILTNEMKKAAEELKTVQQQIHQADLRYKYMALIDLSQEIRDQYIELSNKQNQYTQLITELTAKEKEAVRMAEIAVKVSNEFTIVKGAVEEFEKKYNAVKADIEKARELDVKIQLITEEQRKSKKEIDTLKTQVHQTQQYISDLQKQEIDLKQQHVILTEWFNTHDHYREMIPSIDYIISLVRNANQSKKQYHTALQNLESAQSLLITYQNRLEFIQQEFERLNQLLPSEILNLRKKLEQGKPCPVCGSIHHPLRHPATQQDMIDEKNLETEKKKITEAINLATESIEKTKKSITELEVQTSNYNIQFEKSCNEMQTLLHNFTQGYTHFNEGRLEQELIKIRNKWNENKQLFDANQQITGTIEIRMETEKKNRESLKNQLIEKQDQEKHTGKKRQELLNQRKQLLGNKPALEVEAYFARQKQQLAEQYERLRNTREKTENQKSVTETIIRQLKKDKSFIQEDIRRLQTIVNEWISKKEQQITPETLKELMTKSREWIQSEKYILNELKNKELIAETTFKERSQKLSVHRNSEYKIPADQTKESLLQKQGILTEKSKVIVERLNEINASLLAHQRGREQIKAFEKELITKEELYKNWEKLNILLGSASGNKFKTIAQGYTLDVLLSYANQQLSVLTPRYTLEKIPGTLALQVIDNDMLGELRTVHSLSGGETFLISLALALGLSSLSSNRMKIESLFIDEGFGALDAETLSIAMDALDNLHTQGRKIGVISHVEEMKERITTRIQVIKSSNSKSTIRITG